MATQAERDIIVILQQLVLSPNNTALWEDLILAWVRSSESDESNYD